MYDSKNNKNKVTKSPENIEIYLKLEDKKHVLIISLNISESVKILELKEYISKDFDFIIENMIMFNPKFGILNNDYELPFKPNEKIILELILKDSPDNNNEISLDLYLNQNKNLSDQSIINKNNNNCSNKNGLILNSINNEIKSNNFVNKENNNINGNIKFLGKKRTDESSNASFPGDNNESGSFSLTKTETKGGSIPDKEKEGIKENKMQLPIFKVIIPNEKKETQVHEDEKLKKGVIFKTFISS